MNSDHKHASIKCFHRAWPEFQHACVLRLDWSSWKISTNVWMKSLWAQRHMAFIHIQIWGSVALVCYEWAQLTVCVFIKGRAVVQTVRQLSDEKPEAVTFSGMLGCGESTHSCFSSPSSETGRQYRAKTFRTDLPWALKMLSNEIFIL